MSRFDLLITRDVANATWSDLAAVLSTQVGAGPEELAALEREGRVRLALGVDFAYARWCAQTLSGLGATVQLVATGGGTSGPVTPRPVGVDPSAAPSPDGPRRPRPGALEASFAVAASGGIAARSWSEGDLVDLDRAVHLQAAGPAAPPVSSPLLGRTVLPEGRGTGAPRRDASGVHAPASFKPPEEPARPLEVEPAPRRRTGVQSILTTTTIAEDGRPRVTATSVTMRRITGPQTPITSPGTRDDEPGRPPSEAPAMPTPRARLTGPQSVSPPVSVKVPLPAPSPEAPRARLTGPQSLTGISRADEAPVASVGDTPSRMTQSRPIPRPTRPYCVRCGEALVPGSECERCAEAAQAATSPEKPRSLVGAVRARPRLRLAIGLVLASVLGFAAQLPVSARTESHIAALRAESERLANSPRPNDHAIATAVDLQVEGASSRAALLRFALWLGVALVVLAAWLLVV